MRTEKSKPEAAPDDQEREMELLRGIAMGDEVSFEQLHDRFAPVVYSTVFKVLNDTQDTEDVAQEVFSQIWQKAGLYNRERGKPLTWVATMARNRAIDRFRSKQRRSRLRDEFEEESRGRSFVTHVDSADEVYAKERSRIVRSAVMELSDEQREAIELAYFTGLTQNEIARNLGEPLGTIKARIRRGMMRLRSTVRSKI
ncbi:sigma-70 family RNA polymerase sigma factor [soil metagenome]